LQLVRRIFVAALEGQFGDAGILGGVGGGEETGVDAVRSNRWCRCCRHGIDIRRNSREVAVFN